MHPPSAYHLLVPHLPDASKWQTLAQEIFRQTFRTRFDAPGFSLLSFAIGITSESLRAGMVELKQALDILFHEETGRYLVYQSMARFDQQVTTKFHLDGGPPESFLMLGYEPSEVHSSLAMADYTLAAWKLGIEPAAFVRDHNPMYASGAKLLEGTITALSGFDPRRATILVINNSCVPYDERGRHLLGVMHQATIPYPDSAKQRIVNSTMFRPAVSVDEEALSPKQQQEYIITEQISSRY